MASFKHRERPEAVLFVAGSTGLMRIAVAWSGMRVARKSRLSACREEGGRQGSH